MGRRKRIDIPRPSPEEMRAAEQAVEVAQQELVNAVHMAAQAEQTSRWHIRVRTRNNIGPAMALEYSRIR